MVIRVVIMVFLSITSAMAAEDAWVVFAYKTKLDVRKKYEIKVVKDELFLGKRKLSPEQIIVGKEALGALFQPSKKQLEMNRSCPPGMFYHVINRYKSGFKNKKSKPSSRLKYTGCIGDEQFTKLMNAVNILEAMPKMSKKKK